MFENILKAQATPMYVFDLGALEKRIEYLRNILPKNIVLCYAVKANTFISKKASELTERLEICSPGEYRICKELGLDTQKFVISGVNKEPHFIDELVSQQEIGTYTVESRNQFDLLLDCATRANKKIRLLLRLTSGNQFGMEEAEIAEIIEICKQNPLLYVGGIQYFSGTQKTSLKKLRRELMYLDGYMSELQANHDIKFDELEYGPGMPATYFCEESFDEDAFLTEFSALLNEMTFKGNLVFELGRGIAATCGTYFTSVVDTKCNKGENYAITDGGMHQIVYYGQFMAMKHPKMQLIPERTGEEKNWNICGSLCTANDILVKAAPFADLKPGDIIAFKNTGAYCPIEGISLFLSRDLPKVVLLNADGSYETVRDRIETYALNLPKQN